MKESRATLRCPLGGRLPTILAAAVMMVAAAAAEGAISAPAKLAIYYGYPSLVNEAGGNLTTATAHFAAFDVVVLGDGLEHPAHPDHANTVQIIADLVAGGTEVYGYIDMGVTTQNLSIASASRNYDACLPRSKRFAATPGS